MRRVLNCALGVALLSGSTAMAGQFTDTFDTISPSWQTDRYAPSDFSVQNVGGDNRLQISINTADDAANRNSTYSSSFYDTQGKRRPTATPGDWTVSADLLVTQAMLSTTGPLERTDLWTRDSNPDENAAEYPIIGITNESPTNRYNASASDRLATFRIFDGDSTGWIDLPTAPTPGWHDLSISYTGSSYVYSIDGTTVYTDNTVSTPGNGDLQTTFLEAFNFGDSNYSVNWDNLSVVPEPGTIGLLGSGLMLLARRRRMGLVA